MRPRSGALPRRILFASVDSNWAGAQVQMLELARGLDRSEFEPVLLTCGDGGLVAQSRAAGIPTHVLPLTFLRRRFPFVGYYALGPVSLRRILRRERIALVHAHCPNSGVPIMNAARGLKLPLVAHVHDLDQRWVTHRTLRVQNRARSVVVGISDAAVRYAVERGVEPSHTRRIYNGVHLPAGAPDARAGAREALGIADGEVAVGLVGRLVPRKGQRDLVQAMADPRTRELPLRAYLVGAPERGDTTFEPALRTLAAELGVSHRVRFVGPRDDAPALMAGFDIVAVPSFREAFGRVVVESMHAGTPVVVYRDAALPELVHHEVDGLIVPAGDVAALAAALARLASDPVLRDQLAANGRIRARDFSHERFVAEVTALYRELLAD